MRSFALAVGLTGTCTLLIAGCSSDQGGSGTTPTPTPTPTTASVVHVDAGSRICTTDKTSVPFGQVTVIATSVGKKDVSVTVFGPKAGQWTKAIGVIPLLQPNQTKSMTINLPLGAYEVACQTARDDARARITAV